MASYHLASAQKKLAQGATLIFVDEAGFSLTPITGKTWALRGETPIINHPWSKYARISAISGVTSDNKLFFQLKENETFKSNDIARFLRLLLRHIAGSIVVVWDGAPQHRGSAVRDVLAKHARLSIVRLPGYCPELNPDELVWNHAKNVRLRGAVEPNTRALATRLRREFRSMKKRPDLLRSFLLGSELPWGTVLA